VDDWRGRRFKATAEYLESVLVEVTMILERRS
jgi:hypothetical protein